MQEFAKNETSTQNDERNLFQNFKKSMIVCVSFSFFFSIFQNMQRLKKNKMSSVLMNETCGFYRNTLQILLFVSIKVTKSCTTSEI